MCCFVAGRTQGSRRQTAVTGVNLDYCNCVPECLRVHITASLYSSSVSSTVSSVVFLILRVETGRLWCVCSIFTCRRHICQSVWTVAWSYLILLNLRSCLVWTKLRFVCVQVNTVPIITCGPFTIMLTIFGILWAALPQYFLIKMMRNNAKGLQCMKCMKMKLLCGQYERFLVKSRCTLHIIFC